jgi:16S rRNA (guanine966-N2)-methyltransferase
MTLRVISGRAKGRKLKSVPGDTTRPITDRVKEALFNIIAGDVVDANWWDVFAGTGAVGIEALSRGAALVRFSDSSRAPIETIKFNLEHCGFKSQAEIRKADAFAFLASTPDRTFEYIYIAPPQYQGMWAKALEIIDENIDWLSEDGWVIVQIDPKEYKRATTVPNAFGGRPVDKPLALENLREFEQRKYGSTLLVFYERKAASGVE